MSESIYSIKSAAVSQLWLAFGEMEASRQWPPLV